jgi:hypothetical protein
LRKRGKKNLTPNERVRLKTYEDHIRSYYKDLDELGIDWLRAYSFYAEVSGFKIYAAMGGIIGLDFDRAANWLTRQYRLEDYLMNDVLRRIKIIDEVLTDQYNHHAEIMSKQRSGKGSPGVPGNIMKGRT